MGGSTQSGNLKVKFALLFGSGFLPVFVTAAAEIADSPKNMKSTLSLYNKFLGFHSEVLNSFFGVLKKLFSLILLFFSIVCKKHKMATDYATDIFMMKR